MAKLVTPETRSCYSELQTARLQAPNPLPSVLTSNDVVIEKKEALGAVADHEAIQSLFPVTYGKPRVEFVSTDQMRPEQILKVGVVLSGGQAPGGHNVIAGIFDGIKRCSPKSQMIGFLGGPGGLMKGKYCIIDDEMMDKYRNTGGFDMIASGRDKIESPEQFAASFDVANSLDLDGLIVIGGDDSNTNAALLAENFASKNSKCKVIGCPKTIDGDLKNEFIPISFGFDTACRTFSEEIGNVMVDTLSSQKYYHFIRLMGREAANVALECALQTRPNLCFIGEEVEAQNMSLAAITEQVADMICQRASAGKDYGVVLLPEGLIGFIPEFGVLIAEINEILAQGATPEQVPARLTPQSKAVFDLVPPAIQIQLMLDRDPHGNVQVAMIETEKLVAGAVAQELKKRKMADHYVGKFAAQYHSFGYEGRCAIPTLFDANYCYCLGYNAALLLSKGETGLMSAVTNLDAPVSEWVCGGCPTTMMMNMERRKGKMKPVIKKAVVDLQGRPFQLFASQRDRWATEDVYRIPGPAQFEGPGSDDITFTLHYELTDDDGNGKYAVNVPAPSRPRKMGDYLMLPPKTDFSSVQKARLDYQPKVPQCMQQKSVGAVAIVAGEETQCMKAADSNLMKKMFPSTYGLPLVEMLEAPSLSTTSAKVGVVFSGRQASGMHNVLAGIYEFICKSNAQSSVVGFVGGCKGLLSGEHVVMSDDLIAGYLNSGGCDLLGRTSEKIRTEEEQHAALKTCQSLRLTGLILLGGTRTATDAAYLSEFFKSNGSTTSVVACPCSINGAMKNQFVETAVGFDTTVKCYSQLVGNLSIDGASARKYWYFMRVMGSSPSHTVLEIALQSNPNKILVTEEVAAHRQSLQDVVNELADLISTRSDSGKNFGTLLIPEGLITALPEFSVLIDEIDALYDSMKVQELALEDALPRLSKWSAALLSALPSFAQQEMLVERQSDKKMQLTQVETEKLLAHFVSQELEARKEAGKFNGKFTPVCSYLGYQARSSLPTNFDCDYGFTVGGAAAVLVLNELSGYMPTVSGLKAPVDEWSIGGAPITAMLVADDEEKLPSGQVRPRFPPASVDLNGQAYMHYKQNIDQCMAEEVYKNPGPLQFNGTTADCVTKTLEHEEQNYLKELATLREELEAVRLSCSPGCSRVVLRMAMLTLSTLNEIIDMNKTESGSSMTKMK
mmetsp:Transcript_12000/g.15155  ORF Transcript_12000/g.15155 Transcript_12000/m.15155 type:complete len:1183 (-) Transcript_12000:326-3874(-)